MYKKPRIGTKMDSSIRNYLSLPEAPYWRKLFLHPWLPPEIGKMVMLSDSAVSAAGNMKKMHYAFAFTSNLRGWNAIKELERIKPVTGSRLIDVGCAYGGFIVAAMNAGASQAVGIEINRRLAAIADDNISDNGLRERTQIIVGDALDCRLLDSLGKFDIAICNDVIEHVQDARLLVKHISQLLAPGGIAYLEIPNKRASSFLLSDGHYSLFGITVLPHDQAKKYYEHHFEGKIYENSMGEYYELEKYIDWFGENGGGAEILEAWRSTDALETTCSEYSQFLERLNAQRPSNIPLDIWEILQDYGMRFYRDFDTDRQSMANGGVSEDLFLQRYHDTFWRLIVRR